MKELGYNKKSTAEDKEIQGSSYACTLFVFLLKLCVSRNYIDIFYKSPINKSRSPYYTLLSWSSRIDYFDNNKQNLSRHLDNYYIFPFGPTWRMMLFIIDISQLNVISTSGWLTYKIET